MIPNALDSTETGRVHQHNGTILVKAAECIGVDVSANDIKYFKVASRLAAYLDDMVDTYSTLPDVADLIVNPDAYINNYVNESDMEAVKEVLVELSDERKTEWLKAEELPIHSYNKTHASSILDLKIALMNEAMLFKSIFSLEQKGHDVLERQTFNDWLTHFSKGGYFVDAAVDLSSDYAANRVSIQPTITHRIALSGWALQELRSALQVTRSPRFLLELGKTASATLLEASRS